VAHEGGKPEGHRRDRPGTPMASVFLGDLDDFITPAEACINPMFVAKEDSNKSQQDSFKKMAKVQIGDISADTETSIFAPSELQSSSNKKSKTSRVVKAGASNKKATISLNDCLACSGCVTSAETVLITTQSAAKFKRELQKCIASGGSCHVSIAPQTLASLATEHDESLSTTFGKLEYFFRTMGVNSVSETGGAMDVALEESCREFVQRYRQQEAISKTEGSTKDKKKGRGKTPWEWKMPPYSKAISSTRVEYQYYPAEGVILKDEGTDIRLEEVDIVEKDPTKDSSGSNGPLTNSLVEDEPNSYLKLPMLTSECPGWVCYAEKTHPAALPFISTTKSPQQITGFLIKNKDLCPSVKNKEMKEDSNSPRVATLHVTIMPCFDKKLEASRMDFFHAPQREGDAGWQEVDIVLTTAEVKEMITEEGKEWAKLSHQPSELPLNHHARAVGFPKQTDEYQGTVTGRDGSGPYLETVFRFAAKELFGITIDEPLQFVQGKNKDIHEVTLERDGQILLKFAQAYGFRNIQTVVQKLKRGRCPYHFVEIMACPGGCLNGGGQIKPKEPGPAQVEALSEEVKSTYNKFRQHRKKEDNPLWNDVFEPRGVLKGDGSFSATSRHMFHTRYHAVPKMDLINNPSGLIKW